MGARILDACDAAKAAIESLPSFAGSGAVAERTYTFRGPEGDARIRSVQGRRVYLFPASYTQAATVDRGMDANDYVVTVLVVEVYKGDEPVPPADWLDERVSFVADVYGVLGDARAPLIGGAFVAQNAQVASVYDQDALDEHKTFWSYGEFTLREYA